MQVLLYASRNDKDRNRLETALRNAIPGRVIEHFTRLDALRERFGFIIEPDSVIILLAADHGELRELQMFRELLTEIYVILVVPDWEESTVKLAYLLLPRLLSQKKDSFIDLIKVVKKIARIPQNVDNSMI